MFPLNCGLEDLDAFIDGSRKNADGYVGFYWGKTIEQYNSEKADLSSAITNAWLKYFRAKAPSIRRQP